jgi:hypothetical protein
MGTKYGYHGSGKGTNGMSPKAFRPRGPVVKICGNAELKRFLICFGFMASQIGQLQLGGAVNIGDIHRQPPLPGNKVSSPVLCALYGPASHPHSYDCTAEIIGNRIFRHLFGYKLENENLQDGT